jgi:hypothetical protein
MKKGDRVRVNEKMAPGVGNPPKVGDLGTVDMQLENGTVVVNLDDGRRALLASWEVDLVETN